MNTIFSEGGWLSIILGVRKDGDRLIDGDIRSWGKVISFKRRFCTSRNIRDNIHLFRTLRSAICV